ncbi:MAG: SIS domain-containing protein [Anaerolineaceae bacterium]|jgi:glucosamine--fructose-6-phosphate aminotransferase (isomerizing)
MNSSILFQEICQQPDTLEKLISQEYDQCRKISKSLNGKFKYIIIAARGSSDNAALYAQYLLGANNRIQVSLATPSLFSIYSRPPVIKDALVIGISQSGQSPDIVSVLKEGKVQGCPTVAITNDETSPIADTADFVIPLHTGEEKAVAATKTYSASLAALALLSCCFSDNSGELKQLHSIPKNVETVIQSTLPILDRVERYRYMDRCMVISRGFNYATAFETALKVKELTRVVAEPYSSADFRHGPIATVERGFPVFLIAASGAVYEDLEELSHHLDDLGAEKITVSDDTNFLNSAKLKLSIPTGIPEWLSPIVAIIPSQLFAMQLAIEKGLNVDKPEGLSKVTQTI